MHVVPGAQPPGGELAPPGERLDQRRLAGPVGPDQRDVLAALEPQFGVLEQHDAARRRPRSARRAARRSTRPERSGRRERELQALAVGRVALDALDLRELLDARLRLARLGGLVAEALDEPLHPLDLGLLGVDRPAERELARGLLAPPRCQLPAKKRERPASSSSTAVPTASRNQRSWATSTTAASRSTSVCSSHSSDSMSRWFVGSSSSSTSAPVASARASEARVSWPPEKVSSARVQVRLGEPEPARHRGRAVAPQVAAARLEPRLGARRSGRAAPRPRRRGHRRLELGELGLDRELLRRSRTAGSPAAPSRARAAGAGRAGRSARPWRRSARRGRSMLSPASIRSSVVLPAPLRPAIVSRSRRSSLKETPLSSGLPAMSLCRSEAIRRAIGC